MFAETLNANPFQHFLAARRIERQRNVHVDDVVPIDARLAVEWSDDAIESLIEHWDENGLPTKWRAIQPPEQKPIKGVVYPVARSYSKLAAETMPINAIGWDLFRHDRQSLCGLDQFHRLLIGRDHDYCKQTPRGVSDADRAMRDTYVEARFAQFDRERSPSDVLLIDLADEAIADGWDAPTEIAAAVDQLRELAEQSATRCAPLFDGAESDERRWVRAEYFHGLDDLAYEKWQAAGEPEGRGIKFERWKTRSRNTAIHRAQQLAAKTSIPTAVLDMHKQQKEQYAAAMIGPLPDHPELPIHQAEALSRFWAHLPSGKMIYEGTRELWSPASLDKHIGRVKDAMNPNSGPGMLATTFLSQHRGVQSMGWDPSEPMIINDRVLTQEGWSRGDRTFNRYVPPEIAHVEGDVSIWFDHIRNIYPTDAEHIIKWFAHRVQRPGDKVNHALVFLGMAGIGKDTAIEPVATAIGRHNFKSITAESFFNSDFNGYLKSVILRIDEVHDLGGESKYAFHDRTKPVIAAPPMVHHINEKFVPHYAAKNVCGVILTSNHRDALYLSPDDRRHYVCVSDKRKEDFAPDYFNMIYAWLDAGGNEAVAHYLANLDLSDFNAKAPPPRTEGWHMLVGAGMAPESGDLADAIEALGKPAALTLQMVRSRTASDSPLGFLFQDPKLRKVIPKRLAECGYVVTANPDARDSGGRWRMTAGKVTIYARQDLSEPERLAAARALSMASAIPPPPR